MALHLDEWEAALRVSDESRLIIRYTLCPDDATLHSAGMCAHYVAPEPGDSPAVVIMNDSISSAYANLLAGGTWSDFKAAVEAAINTRHGIG